MMNNTELIERERAVSRWMLEDRRHWSFSRQHLASSGGSAPEDESVSASISLFTALTCMKAVSVSLVASTWHETRAGMLTLI